MIQHRSLVHGGCDPFGELDRSILVEVSRFENAVGLFLWAQVAQLFQSEDELVLVEDAVEVFVDGIEYLAHLLLLLRAQQMDRNEGKDGLLHFETPLEGLYVAQYVYSRLVLIRVRQIFLRETFVEPGMPKAFDCANSLFVVFFYYFSDEYP